MDGHIRLLDDKGRSLARGHRGAVASRPRIDQRQLAAPSGLPVATTSRTEASDGVIRGNLDTLMTLIAARPARLELIGASALGQCGGLGVWLKARSTGTDRDQHFARSTPRALSG
jgi:hypothetical protein